MTRHPSGFRISDFPTEKRRGEKGTEGKGSERRTTVVEKRKALPFATFVCETGSWGARGREAVDERY